MKEEKEEQLIKDADQFEDIGQSDATFTLSDAQWVNLSGYATVTITSNRNFTGLAFSDFEIIDSDDQIQTGWDRRQIDQARFFEHPSPGRYVAYALINAPPNISGEFRIRLKANSVRSSGSLTDNAPPSAITSNSIQVNSTAHIQWGITETSNTITISAQAQRNFVTGVEYTDFEILNSNDQVQTGWTFTGITSSRINAGATTTITATPPANTNGVFKVRLKADSFLSGGQTNALVPETAEISNPISINNTANPSATAFYWTLHSLSTSEYLLYFLYGTGSNFRSISASNFEVINDANPAVVQTGWTIPVIAGGTINNNRSIQVRANPPANTNGNFAIRLKPNSVLTSDNRSVPPTAVASQFSFIDTIPQLRISSFTAPASSSVNPITTANSVFRLTFNVAISETELTTADFQSLNSDATISSVAAYNASNGTASVFDITVINPISTQGTYEISINTNSVTASSTYKAGPLQFDSRTSSSVTFDTRTAISVSSFIPYPNNILTSPENVFVLTLDRSVPTGEIDTSDFTVQSGSGASIRAVRPQNAIGGVTNVFNIDVTNPTNNSGSYTISLNQNVVSGTGTNYKPGPIAAQASTAVAYDTRGSVEGSSFTAPSGTQRGTTSIFRLVLNRAVPITQITIADFTASITQATIASVTGISISNNMTATYDVTVNNPTNGAGTYTVSLNANAVDAATNYGQGPSSAYQSTEVTYNTFPFSVTWEASEFTNNKLTASISFSHNVTEIAASDFEVINDSNAIQTGWTFDTPSTTANAGNNITIAATAPIKYKWNFCFKSKSRFY